MAEKKQAPKESTEKLSGGDLVKRLAQAEAAINILFGLFRLVRKMLYPQFGDEGAEFANAVDRNGDGIVDEKDAALAPAAEAETEPEPRTSKSGRAHIGFVGLLAVAMTAISVVAAVPYQAGDVENWDTLVAIRVDGDLECATNMYVMGTMYATNGGFVGDLLIDDVTISATPLDFIFPDAATTAELGRLRFDAQATGTNISDGDFFVIGLLAEDDLENEREYSAFQFIAADTASNSVDGAISAVYYAGGVLVTNATIDASGLTLASGSFIGDGSLVTGIDASNITAATVLTAIDINAGTNINGANIAIGSDVSINALTLADVFNLGTSTQVITNGQLLVALGAGVNNLDPTGEASGGTCTVTIGVGTPGAFYAVANASTDTNKLAIAQAGFWTGPAIELEVGDPMIVFYGATNKAYGVEQ